MKENSDRYYVHLERKKLERIKWFGGMEIDKRKKLETNKAVWWDGNRQTKVIQSIYYNCEVVNLTGL